MSLAHNRPGAAACRQDPDAEESGRWENRRMRYAEKKKETVMARHRKKTALASVIITLTLCYWMGTLIAESITERRQLYLIQTEIDALTHKMGGDVTTSHEASGLVSGQHGKANLTLRLHPDLRDDLAEPADIRTGLVGSETDGYQLIFADITIRSEWKNSMVRRWPLNPLSMIFYLAMSAILSRIPYMVGVFIIETATEAMEERRERAA